MAANPEAASSVGQLVPMGVNIRLVQSRRRYLPYAKNVVLWRR